jgi:glutamate synthase domain-containing protein 2/glutamate synthase domain-containing protein 1/glutamate synthase domain-containing protein 3
MEKAESSDGQRSRGLYDPANEHDSCGVGFVANIEGQKSADIVRAGIEVLANLVHRGAAGGDGKTGDGAGILSQIPRAFFSSVCGDAGIRLPPAGFYGVGMVFMPHDEALAARCRALIENTIQERELDFLGWREVPVQPSALGEIARSAQPRIFQFFAGDEPEEVMFERKLYLARRIIEQKALQELKADSSFYLPSLSARTIVYKGMMMGAQISDFFSDLRDPLFSSAIAVVHQRYSTNTFPSWKLAQPFRYLSHNGEINTLKGNRMQMRSREASLASALFGKDMKHVIPVLDETGSDSANLDNALELLTLAGRDLAHAMMMLIPQAWGPKYPMGPDLRGFYEYHAGIMEPWDGPAAVAFTDGSVVGALLDRNGLRPSRYTVTRDGMIVLASETGVLDFSPSKVVEKGALRPGQMLLVDTREKRIIKDGEVKAVYSHRQPYRRWVAENRVELHGLFNDVAPVAADPARLRRREMMFGYTREDVNTVIAPMAASGNEPTGSMGYDAPLAVLSEKPQLLYAYFKQLFAQVTNPPIDPIREELVMSLMTFMGNPPNILNEEPANAVLVKLVHPILSNEDTERLKRLNRKGLSATVLPMGFAGEGKPGDLESAIELLCDRAEESVRSERKIIVLSDRDLPADQAPMPALLAVAAVNQRLIKCGLRTAAGIVVETGEAREVHHMAVLLGYGATLINPYMAFEIVADLVTRNALDTAMEVTDAIEHYIKALCKGLLKIMSKMGISTLRSYRNAQIFEAVGLHSSFVDRYFSGTASRIGGIGMEEIESETRARFRDAVLLDPMKGEILPSGGAYRYRSDGERHLWNPETISLIQQATRTNDRSLYQRYAKLINEQDSTLYTLRGMFRFRETAPVPIEQVEPVESIMKRFMTSAMSFGSISREAHETLAIAMNSIGAMSNSGEGGEDPERFKPGPEGRDRCSAIKQIASGRFGVTIDYLVHARELQIKMAQGAKPGEGGQLPGHKVNEEIARVRNSTPGVTLISPPPHHDIYSIEDIKQLIFDLKNANPQARVSVKLVSEVGVGTIAAGVAKGHADMVLISGYDGGTGASPISSIRHAGMPWEIGLSETQQTLVLNGLRDRIRLQVDGQIKTGRDVIIGALLGAEEFGFATAPLVVCGCVMMRKCHLNTCPVGVATQDPELRKRFTGKPEYVVNFMRFIAGEVREHMARLGFRCMDEMIGRSDLLDVSDSVNFWKARNLDFSKVFAHVSGGGSKDVRFCRAQDHEIKDVLDRKLIEKSLSALERKEKVRIEMPIRNVNRAVGTMLSGEVARRYGLAGLPDGTIECYFTGSAGQSFGAFGAAGLTLTLEGESNDYLGKGLSGSRIIVKPPAAAAYRAENNVICGNVLLYGATSGEVFIRGRAGERFAIRNSGAVAVVEGVGDQGCEYMTGGRVVILGETGVNFAAGMSGGIAYVFDESRQFEGRCNLDMVDLEMVTEEHDIEELRGLIRKHAELTGSARAAGILSAWEQNLPLFIKVFPMEYRRVLGRMTKADEATEREEVPRG